MGQETYIKLEDYPNGFPLTVSDGQDNLDLSYYSLSLTVRKGQSVLSVPVQIENQKTCPGAFHTLEPLPLGDYDIEIKLQGTDGRIVLSQSELHLI